MCRLPLCAVLVMTSACAGVFDLEHVGLPAPDAAFDAMFEDAPEPTGTCFADDFAGPAIDPARWAVSETAPADARITNGELELLTAINPGVTYAEVYGEFRSYVNDSFEVELTAIADSGTFAEQGVSLQRDPASRFMILIAKGALILRLTRVGMNQDLYVHPYDPVLHRFLRVRHTANTVYWDTSKDGSSWTVRRQVAPPFDVTSLHPVLFAGTYREETVEPGAARFDNARVDCQP